VASMGEPPEPLPLDPRPVHLPLSMNPIPFPGASPAEASYPCLNETEAIPPGDIKGQAPCVPRPRQLCFLDGWRTGNSSCHLPAKRISPWQSRASSARHFGPISGNY